MISLDQHKDALNQAGLEMLSLCVTQLEHAQEAFFKHDSDLAEEVLHTENRVNAMDLKSIGIAKDLLLSIIRLPATLGLFSLLGRSILIWREWEIMLMEFPIIL